MLSSVGAFAVFAAVLTVTPGLDTMVVLRTTAAGGRHVGIAGVAGVALGCLAWAVASALGVTAVLAASRLAFEAVRVAGVGYLCWLGLRTLWQAIRGSPAGHASGGGLVRGDAGVSAGGPPGPPSAGFSGRWAFRLGLATNLLNPKVGVFYLSAMPQFLPRGISPLAGSLTLAAVHVAEGVVWLSLVVVGVDRARVWLARPAVRRRLELLTGVAFLAFGVGLAAEPRVTRSP